MATCRAATIPTDHVAADHVAADHAELIVDLDAVVANWRALSAAHPSGPVAAVLKADGYGLGGPPIAARLHAAGCRYFFTAFLHEAVAIRPYAPEATIAVLNDTGIAAAAVYREHAILPVIASAASLRAWAALGEDAAVPAMLQVDTGMARTGLPPEEVADLAADPSWRKRIDLRFIITHLAAAETPADPSNEMQRSRFAALCAALPPAPRSLANSSGIFLGPAYGSDLARAGAALYGVNPVPGRGVNPMRPVATLRARVLQTRGIGAGEAVGYNGTWRAARASRIATVGVGYADGWPRALSNRGAARFDGRPVPLVGRVSMDLTTYDVTDLPDLRAGSWIELLGPRCTAEDVARAAGTNAYEILTSLGPRYARTYIG